MIWKAETHRLQTWTSPTAIQATASLGIKYPRVTAPEGWWTCETLKCTRHIILGWEEKGTQIQGIIDKYSDHRRGRELQQAEDGVEGATCTTACELASYCWHSKSEDPQVTQTQLKERNRGRGLGQQLTCLHIFFLNRKTLRNTVCVCVCMYVYVSLELNLTNDLKILNFFLPEKRF